MAVECIHCGADDDRYVLRKNVPMCLVCRKPRDRDRMAPGTD